VTGGAGFIGSHTVGQLLAGGCRVVIVDDFSNGKRANLAAWANDPRLLIVTANIADGLFAPLADVVRQRGPIERIIHLAAQVEVARSIQNPLEDIRTNYVGTVQVLEYARCGGARKVVFASSAAVYGDDVALPVTENAAVNPVSPYGINKLGGEKYLYYYTQVHHVPTVALRFFNVYGPRQDPRSPYSGVISIFAERALTGQPLIIFGDGEQTRDFVFVGDVARVVVDACLSDAAAGAVFNIGTGTESTINQLARLILELTSGTSGIHYEPARPGDIVRSLAAVAEAERQLGFRAQAPLVEGLRQTLDWLRQPPD
jgi:UDP-glucose 4-epimerase